MKYIIFFEVILMNNKLKLKLSNKVIEFIFLRYLLKQLFLETCKCYYVK